MSDLISRQRRARPDLVVTLAAAGAAGSVISIDRAGRAYHVIDATTDGVVKIGLSQEPDQFIYKAVGEMLDASEADFTEIRLLNTSATPQTVTIKTAFGEIKDSRLNLIGGTVPISGAVTVSNTVSISEAYPGTITPQAVSTIAATSNLDISSNANRKLLALYNDSATLTVWLRDQAGTSAIGEPIGPKQSWRGTFKGACRVRNPNASSVDLYVTEYTA